MSSEEKDYLKPPRFGGTEEEWRVWSSNFLSILVQKKMEEIVDFLDSPENIPRDDDLCMQADGVTPDTAKQTLKKQNKRAYALLQTSINYKTSDGLLAWNNVENFKDRNGGYKDGDFKKAWKVLEEFYEPKDATSLADLVDEYNKKRLSRKEDPALMISFLQSIKARMKDQGHTITEDQFIVDVLSKLPSAKKEGEVPPYEDIKREIQRDISSGARITWIAVQRLLHSRYKVLYPKQESQSNEVALNASQVKVKCFKCGEWGHKSFNCPQNKGSKNGSSSKKNGSGKKETRTCFYCKKPGHIKADCRQWKAKNGDKENSTKEVNASTYEIVLTAKEEEPEEWVFCEYSFFDVFEFGGPEEIKDEGVIPEWSLDTEEEWCCNQSIEYTIGSSKSEHVDNKAEECLDIDIETEDNKLQVLEEDIPSTEEGLEALDTHGKDLRAISLSGMGSTAEVLLQARAEDNKGLSKNVDNEANIHKNIAGLVDNESPECALQADILKNKEVLKMNKWRGQEKWDLICPSKEIF